MSIHREFELNLGLFARAGRADAAPRHPLWLIVGTSLWIASAGNLALWRELAQLGLLQGVRGVAFGLAIGALVLALLLLLIGLLAWRGTLKPVLSLLLFASAVGTHFMFTYRIVLDSSMVTNVLQTHPREVLDLMSARLFMTVVVLGLLPAIWVWRTPVRIPPWPRQIVHNGALVLGGPAAAVIVLPASFQPFSSAMRDHRHVRYLANPLNMVHALVQLAARRPERVVARKPVGLQGRVRARPDPGDRCRRRRALRR